ncbi:MAG: MerR family DNA-binding transcriptional regulator, partial [Microgenomates group bacterium]
MSTSPTLKPKKNLVSIGKAAEILGVSIDTIRRWDKAGAIHTYREEGKARRFSLDELREMKASKPLSISEAAIKLGVSASTLRRIEKKGLLVPQRNSIGEREYSRNSIKTYMAREGQQNKGVPLSTNDAIETEIDQIPVPARVLIDNSVYASEKAREFPVYEPRAAGMFASESESARNEVEPRIADAAIRKISRTQYKFNARNIFMATSMLGFIAMLVFGAIGAQTVFNSVTKDRAVAVRLNFEKVDKQPQVLAASTDKGLLSRINDSLSQLLARLPWSSSANKNVSIVAQVKKDAQVNIADVQKALASSAISEKETIYFAIPAVFQKNITAPNVIYSVTAGTGVTITGDTQNPVINAVSSTVASGVSSLQGSTGSVVLTAGSGISIDGLTISSSISSSTEQTFNTISVSGQSDVVADSSTDTLTLTAGTGIVITTDASGDIVTITNSGSSSASGFIDNGTVVSLTTSTDNVTLGSTTDLAKLGIDGEADEIQLLVQGNSTQTTSLIVAENSSGTDVYTVSNTGDVVQTGSLTFSSVGTDITTGSGEDLTVVANGIGIINLNDNVVITGTTDLQGNVSNSTGTLTFADNVSVTGSTTLGDNTSDTITFNAGVSGAGISFASSTFGTCTALETVGGVL